MQLTMENSEIYITNATSIMMKNDHIIITINDQEVNECINARQNVSKRMKIIKGVIISFIVIFAFFAPFNQINRVRQARKLSSEQLLKRRGFQCDKIALSDQSIDSSEIPKKFKWNPPKEKTMSTRSNASNWPKDSSLKCKQLLIHWTQFRENHKQLDDEQIKGTLQEGLMAIHEFNVTSYDEPAKHLKALIWSKQGDEIIEHVDQGFFEHEFDDAVMMTAAVNSRLLKDGFFAVMHREQTFGTEENEENWFELVDLKKMNWIIFEERLGEIWIGLGEKKKTNKIWKLKFRAYEYSNWIRAIRQLAAK